MNEVETRRATQEDVPYIIASWLNHYKDHSYFAQRIKRSVFYHWHHKVATGILMRDGTSALVIHPVGEPEILFGFLVTERQSDRDVIHFAFVKKELRRMGLLRLMLNASLIDLDSAIFTHWTMTTNDLIKKFPKLTYDPYRI